MKRYDQLRTKQAEVAQLIVLHSLFSMRDSKEIIFQGGTSIRWLYGGLRFSEDLGFVTSLPRDKTVSLVDSVQRTGMNPDPRTLHSLFLPGWSFFS